MLIPIVDPPAELTTARLRLRAWRDADRRPFAELNADPQVMEHFPARLTRSESDAAVDRLQAQIELNGWGFWAVELASTGEFLGFVGLAIPGRPLPCGPCVEIGWRLARSAWGNGYATEAARRCLRFGFETLLLPEIVSFTALANRRSRAVMERIGLQDSGKDFDHPALPEGHPLRRHCLYRIVRADWRRGPDEPAAGVAHNASQRSPSSTVADRSTPPAFPLENTPMDDLVALQAAYARGVSELAAAVAGMSPAELDYRPSPDVWTTREVVCHLVDFDIINADRIKRIVAEERPLLLNADPEPFAARLAYGRREVADELALMEALRRQVSAILSVLTSDDWGRVGVHSTDGELTLLQLVRRATKHVPHHLPFIAEKRAAFQRRSEAPQG